MSTGICRYQTCHALVLTALCVAAGCNQPHVDLIGVRCIRTETDGRLESLAFDAAIDTRGYGGQQLVYLVEILDRNSRPVPSSDDRYATSQGFVAVGRTFPVSESPQRIDPVRVVLPATELELKQSQLPASARMSVRTVDGEVLSTRYCQLAIESAMEVAPPMDADAPPAKPGEFWFALPEDEDWPVLVGPIDPPPQVSGSEGESARTLRVLDTDYLWFVPIRLEDAPRRPYCVGPCVSEASAKVVAKALSERGRGLAGVDPPVKLRLATGLEQQVKIARGAPKDDPGSPPRQSPRHNR